MKKYLNVYLLLLLLCTGLTIKAQNLYDTKHSKQFAGYLFDNGEYKMAAKEYYRLYVTTPYNDSITEMLVTSLFLSEQYKRITSILEQSDKTNNIPCCVSSLYTKSLILSTDYDCAKNYISTTDCFTEEKRDYFALANKLLHNQYSSLQYSSDSKFSPVLKQIESVRYKKVWASVMMSAVIPGSGKVYSGYWKDGLFSFIMVGLSTWQAWSGFNKKGIKSAYGWINGGLALAFYSGNIYGSIKAANQYNYNINHEIYHHAKAVFLLPD